MKFLKSVVDEMKQVTWPTGKDMAKDVGTVVVTVFLFSIFFAVVDFGVKELMNMFIF